VRAALPSLVVPEHAIDAQSLIALADLVVSAGGTMNREAVALGTPVWTTFAGRLGSVDESLIADGRLAELVSADALVVEKCARHRPAAGRDPNVMLELLLSARQR
jgi:predicted glycosyltransferase